MSYWLDKAIKTLEKSLKPIPQEINELDWKSDISSKSERLAQHISAFANYKGGGFFVFGINNDATFNDLAGVDVDNLVNRLGNVARNNLAQPVAIDHIVFSYNDHSILFVYVPEASDKPVNLRGKDFFESYKRSAGQTVKLTKDEVKQLIAISYGYGFEKQIALANIEDDEVLSNIDYDNYFNLASIKLPETKKGILEKLESEEFVNKNFGTWDITNLGAILFAKNLTVFKDLRRKAVRVIVYEGTSKIVALKEQEGARGYANGFEGLIAYIMDQLQTSEVIEKALREKVKIYPEVAVREFVANALIHQDLTVKGSGVMIEIFGDRIEITNPGVPLVDTNRFIDTAPKSRNEVLASVMRRLNICEERGSGIDRAVAAIEIYQLPAPKFLSGDDYTRIIMYSPRALTKMSIEDRVRACYQHTCLHYVNNEPVNNQSVRIRFNISKNNVSFASKIISETLEAKLIKPSDPDNQSKKFASYVPFWA